MIDKNSMIRFLEKMGWKRANTRGFRHYFALQYQEDSAVIPGHLRMISLCRQVNMLTSVKFDHVQDEERGNCITCRRIKRKAACTGNRCPHHFGHSERDGKDGCNSVSSGGCVRYLEGIPAEIKTGKVPCIQLLHDRELRSMGAKRRRKPRDRNPK